ncbi:MAG: type II toxin-antitoxin system HicA family toxin [Isosphaeraceae bacterium]
MKVSEVLRRLRADGWVRVKSKGGHRQFKHATKPGRPGHGLREAQPYPPAGDAREDLQAGRVG